ncbi:competence protein CoiA family protein [Colwellia sp. MEBiC06753]
MNSQTRENKNVELVYGLRSGLVVSINDVKQGLDCGCKCPYCCARLVAKKGDIRQHHFAHYDNEDCTYGPETAIHLLAKQVIKDNAFVMLPSSYVKIERQDDIGLTHQYSIYEQERAHALNNIEVEKAFDGFQPDVSAIMDDGQALDIEILVTHAVDKDKARVHAQTDRKMLEIDLSCLPRTSSIQEVTCATLYSAPRRYISERPNINSIIESNLTKVNQSHHSHRKLAALSAKPEDKVLLLGYKFGEGYSPKFNSNFKLGHIYFPKPVQRSSTKNFSVKASGGVELDKRDVDESVLPALEKLNLPALVSLTFEARLSAGNSPKFVVTGIEVDS